MNQQSQSDEEDAFHKKYIKVQKIAQGSYGIVWKARNTQNGQIVAIKKFKNLSNQGLPVSAVRQIHILNKLKTSYVLHALQLCVKTRSVQMVSQWKQVSLLRMIKQMQSYNTRSIIRQIVRGVDSIHQCYIFHRDLKPANIVLDDIQGHNLKIIDFGMAKQIKWDKKVQMTNEVGTLYYRAPQLLNGSKKYNKSIDVWSIGCIFYELLTKKVLFKGENQLSQIINIYQEISTQQEKSMLIQIKNKQIEPIKSQNWENIRQQLCKLPQYERQLDLLKRILQIDPKKRPTCKQILQHSYFSQA